MDDHENLIAALMPPDRDLFKNELGAAADTAFACLTLCQILHKEPEEGITKAALREEAELLLQDVHVPKGLVETFNKAMA